jgi:hypothetical protein
MVLYFLNKTSDQICKKKVNSGKYFDAEGVNDFYTLHKNNA